MKVYNTQKEVEADIVNGVLKIDDDVTFNCDIKIKANIVAHNIDAYNIIAYNINANNIDANNIKAVNIKAGNINANNIDAYNIIAYNINANDINAYNIDASDINAYNIDALNINADNINFYAFCISYNNIKCTSIKGRRENHLIHCLDGKLLIKGNIETIEIEGKKYNKNEVQKFLNTLTPCQD